MFLKSKSKFQSIIIKWESKMEQFYYVEKLQSFELPLSHEDFLTVAMICGFCCLAKSMISTPL